MKTVVILDNGSGFIKAGFNFEDEPSVTSPILIGRPRYRSVTTNVRETFIGNQAKSMRAVCHLSSPSKRGLINSYDDQALVFEDLFSNELEVDPCDHPVLLSQMPHCMRHQELRLTAELFERLSIPSLVKKQECALSLSQCGLTTGCVVDCGDSLCHTSAMYYGEILLNSVCTLELGGSDTTEYLNTVLTTEIEDCKLRTGADQMAKTLKDSVLANSGRSFSLPSSFDYGLPDGEKIQAKTDRNSNVFDGCNLLFEPIRLGLRAMGLSDMLLTSIQNSPSSLRPTLSKNVVLCGGSSMLSGLSQRLKAEVGRSNPIYLICPPKPELTVWRGGALISRLSTFDDLAVTREEYWENGPIRAELKFS